MQGQNKPGVTRSGTKVYSCAWKLTADLYDVPVGTTFVCANKELISLGSTLAHFNRKQDNLRFVLAPPNQQVSETARGKK